jgi:hypothetical protein
MFHAKSIAPSPFNSVKTSIEAYGIVEILCNPRRTSCETSYGNGIAKNSEVCDMGDAKSDRKTRASDKAVGGRKSSEIYAVERVGRRPKVVVVVVVVVVVRVRGQRTVIGEAADEVRRS